MLSGDPEILALWVNGGFGVRNCCQTIPKPEFGNKHQQLKNIPNHYINRAQTAWGKNASAKQNSNH